MQVSLSSLRRINVCIFPNVLYITDLTCGLRWPYSKRMLELRLQSFVSPLLNYCSIVLWEYSILKCKRPLSTPTHNHFCAFTFFFFYMILEKIKMLVFNAVILCIYCCRVRVRQNYVNVIVASWLSKAHTIQVHTITKGTYVWEIFLSILNIKTLNGENYKVTKK